MYVYSILWSSTIIVADMILLVLLIAKIVNLFLLLHFSSLNEKKKVLVQFFPSQCNSKTNPIVRSLIYNQKKRLEFKVSSKPFLEMA